MNKQLVTCQICKQQKPVSQTMPAELVGGPVLETIRKQHADWSPEGYICLSDLNHFRTEHVQELLQSERGELSDLDRDVVKSLHEQELLSKNVNAEFDRRLTIGDRRCAECAGREPVRARGVRAQVINLCRLLPDAPAPMALLHPFSHSLRMSSRK